jgi:hypothetical protein
LLKVPNGHLVQVEEKFKLKLPAEHITQEATDPFATVNPKYPPAQLLQLSDPRLLNVPVGQVVQNVEPLDAA